VGEYDRSWILATLVSVASMSSDLEIGYSASRTLLAHRMAQHQEKPQKADLPTVSRNCQRTVGCRIRACCIGSSVFNLRRGALKCSGPTRDGYPGPRNDYIAARSLLAWSHNPNLKKSLAVLPYAPPCFGTWPQATPMAKLPALSSRRSAIKERQWS
jgi:hypothetical protein